MLLNLTVATFEVEFVAIEKAIYSAKALELSVHSLSSWASRPQNSPTYRAVGCKS